MTKGDLILQLLIACMPVFVLWLKQRGELRATNTAAKAANEKAEAAVKAQTKQGEEIHTLVNSTASEAAAKNERLEERIRTLEKALNLFSGESIPQKKEG